MHITRFEDAYHSPKNVPGPLSRAFPNLAFYARVFSIVCQAAWQTRRGYSMSQWTKDSLTFIRYAEASGLRLHIENLCAFTALPGPCVLVANHMSTLETFCLPGILAAHKPIVFVLKRSLSTYPLFRRVVNSIEHICVDRINPRDDFKAVMEQGQERLERGVSIVVFPQTTRTKTLDRNLFNSIGIKLAKKAGVPVLPVALKTDAWGTGRILKDFGPICPHIPVHFCFGKPTLIQGAGKIEHEEIMDFIQGKLTSWATEENAIP